MRALTTVYRTLLEKIQSGPLVLLYHRVSDAYTDPWGLCVSPRQFRNHLELLRAKRVEILPLAHLIEALLHKQLPRRGVAITFDDGYADNLFQAEPLLTEFRAPATFFLTVGQIGSPREFWWDALERIFLLPGELPQTLELIVNGEHCQWVLGCDSNYKHDVFKRLRHWRAREPAPSARHVIFLELWNRVRQLTNNERHEVIERLSTWAGVPTKARSSHRTLAEEEVRCLGANGFEIAAHSWSHPDLCSLSVDEQRRELQTSRTHLEAVVRRRVDGFSYPHGLHSPETVNLVEEAGYAYGCGTAPELLRNRAKRFLVPRIGVGDWKMPAFERFLADWHQI